MFDREFDNLLVNGETYGDPPRQHEIFTRLRRHDPVHWTEPDHYRPFWTLSKNADIVEVEKQQTLFIAAPRSKLYPRAFEQKMLEETGGSPHLGRSIAQMDLPEHRTYRRIAQEWFLPKNLERLSESIASLARQSVDSLLERQECDAYKDVCSHFPLRVIMLMLGLPHEDEPHLLDVTKRFFAGQDPEVAKGTDLIDASRDYKAYFGPLVDEKRRTSSDDLASIIANSKVDGQLINRAIATSYFTTLANAGHDTTGATAAGGILAFIENPDQWQQLKRDQSLVPKAVEEIIRWVSPVKHFFRTATADYELRGRKIHVGDFLLECYPSGNRDEEVFEEPFSFRIDRTPNRHIGFGFGPHVCLGMALARLELQIFFREILQRVEGFELTGKPRWVQTNFVGGLKTLPVRVLPV